MELFQSPIGPVFTNHTNPFSAFRT